MDVQDFAFLGRKASRLAAYASAGSHLFRFPVGVFVLHVHQQGPSILVYEKSERVLYHSFGLFLVSLFCLDSSHFYMTPTGKSTIHRTVRDEQDPSRLSRTAETGLCLA